jgi:hypothetical protein
MGGDNDQWIVTYQFERPPNGKFTFKVFQDAEGPAYWSAELNGKKCEKDLS